MMTDVDNFQYVREHVRTVPDFPKKGIMFLDITTATKDAKSMQYMTDFLYIVFGIIGGIFGGMGMGGGTLLIPLLSIFLGLEE